MEDSNKTTLKVYESMAQEYVDETPQTVPVDVKNWIDAMLEGANLDAKIVEIGSATGRDADYIESLGYSVQRTDAAQSFVDLMRQQGKSAELFNVVTDDFVAKHDIAFANAVLVHLDRSQTGKVIKKIYDALNPEGRFAFSLLKGQGEKWSDSKMGARRYFCYWDEADIRVLLKEVGFKWINLSEVDNSQIDDRWLRIVAMKQ